MHASRAVLPLQPRCIFLLGTSRPSLACSCPPARAGPELPCSGLVLSAARADPQPRCRAQVKLWNPSTGASLRTVESGYGLCALFAPGGRHAVVGTKARPPSCIAPSGATTACSTGCCCGTGACCRDCTCLEGTLHGYEAYAAPRSGCASRASTRSPWPCRKQGSMGRTHGASGPIETRLSGRLNEQNTSIGQEGTLEVVDVGAGERVAVEQAHKGPVWSIAALPDGSGLVSGRWGAGF